MTNTRKTRDRQEELFGAFCVGRQQADSGGQEKKRFSYTKIVTGWASLFIVCWWCGSETRIGSVIVIECDESLVVIIPSIYNVKRSIKQDDIFS